jgi:hypothetical protein
VPPALAPITPEQLRDILLDYGYRIERETELNWSLVRVTPPGSVDPDPPIIVPKEGERVAVDVMMNAILVQAKMNLAEYWALKEKHVPVWQNYPELKPPGGE